MQQYPIHVKGDSFCFLYSIQEVLSKGHNITLELLETRQLILDHLCCNTEKYLTFYTNISQDVLITSSNLLLEEIIGFFNKGNFNTNVVDLLLICVDALSLEIFVFQNSDGSIQILQIPGGPFAKKIYLKFTHDNKYTAGNHYILLIKNRKLQETTPWPAGYIMKPGINTEQTEVMDLSTSSVHYSKSQENEETNEEPSLPSVVRTLDHTYARHFEECQDEDKCEYEEVENHHYSSQINSSQSTTSTQ